jgi:hypothetical protein
MILQIIFDKHGEFIDYKTYHCLFAGKKVERYHSKYIINEFAKRSNILSKPNYLHEWRYEAKKHLFKRALHWVNPLRIVKIRKEQVTAGLALFMKAIGR